MRDANCVIRNFIVEISRIGGCIVQKVGAKSRKAFDKKMQRVEFVWRLRVSRKLALSFECEGKKEKVNVGPSQLRRKEGCLSPIEFMRTILS